MKNALVVAAREFKEKRFVAYAALAIAILPLVFAAIPVVGGNSPRDTIAVASLVFATGFALALAVMSGASFIGRDLSDGRMSFYFSRPVASASIWFGKLTAAILMIVGCFAVIVAPAWLAVEKTWTTFSTISLRDGSALGLMLALVVFLLAHVIGTFARSRSPLIAVDFAAAVVCAVAIRFLVQTLAAGQASYVFLQLTISLVAALVIAIVGGGAWQLARGRTDRRRNHLALSQFLWGTMAIALLIAAGYVTWVVSVTPSDLGADFRATRSTSGPFAVITGKARGRADYRVGFLLNTESGSVTHVDYHAEWLVRYTRDGRSVLIPVLDEKMQSADVLIYHEGAKEPIDTGLSVQPGGYFVSDDGGRIATISLSGILSVYDIAQKRSLASVMLPSTADVQAFFLSPDVLRLYLQTGKGPRIMELDVRARGLRDTGSVAAAPFWINPDASVDHLLVRPERGSDVVTLNDARTGALITTLGGGTPLQVARFLRDGRIALVDGPASASVLHILSPGGVLQHDVPLGPAGTTIFVGDDGKRVVLFHHAQAGHGALIAVDLDRGVVERSEAVPWWVPSGVVDPRPPIQPLRDVFYGDANGHLLSWNPATGAKRRIT